MRTVWRGIWTYRSAAFGLERGLSCLRFPPRMAAPSGAVAVSIVTGARTFPSPFGMTDMQWREDADLADSGASGLRVVVVLLRSTKWSLSEVDLATELPCFLTVKSLRQYHAKGVLLPQYVAEGGRHSGFIPLTRESGMREACNVVARSRFRKTERKESSRLLMRHEQTVNRCTESGRVLRGIIAPILRRENANQAIDSVMRRLRTPKESVPLL